MRRKRIKGTIQWLAPGCLLWLSCPSGTTEFLAPIVQPIVSGVLSQVTDVFTDRLLGSGE